MSNAAHHSFGRLAFPFVTPVFPWLGKNKSTSRSHFKPLTLQMRNPRKSTLSARCSTICITLLCLLSLPAISFPQHTSLKFLSLSSHGHFSCSIQPGPPPCQTPRIILSPHYFLKTTQQHQQNWPLISSWDTAPTGHLLLLGFLYLTGVSAHSLPDLSMLECFKVQFLGLLSTDIHSLKR